MNTCKTCAHWIDPDLSSNDDYHVTSICKPWDADTNARMVTGIEVRMCRHPAQTFSERPVEKNGFGVVDGSEYYARLITAEDFGCVRHESLLKAFADAFSVIER